MNIASGLLRGRITLLGLAAIGLLLAAALMAGELSAQEGERGSILGLTLTSDNPGELVISWSDPDPAPSDYRISWAPEGEDHLSYKVENEIRRGNAYPDGTARSYTVEGLPEGAEYKVRIRARFNQGGNNPWSGPWASGTVSLASAPEDNSQTTTDPTPEPAPAPTPEPASVPERTISGLTLVSDSPGTLSITWDVPAPIPHDYRLRWARSNESFVSYTETDRRGNDYPVSNSLTLTGLDEGVEYKVEVRARYDGTSGPWSDEVRLRVAAGPGTEPTPNQTPDSPTPTQHISTIPGIVGGLQGRVVNRDPTGGSRQGLTGSASSTTTRATTTGKSVPRTAVTIQNSEVHIVLTWDAPSEGATPDGYRIYRSVFDYALGYYPAFSVLVTGITDETYTDNDVDRFNKYRYRVSALVGDVEGPQSNIITITPDFTPSVVRNLSVNENPQGTANLAWERPATPPQGTCTYSVRRLLARDGGIVTSLLAQGLTDTSYADTRLVPGGFAHGYTVWATCGGFAGETEFVLHRSLVRVAVPGNPTNVTQERSTDGDDIVVKWEHPKGTGISFIVRKNNQITNFTITSTNDVHAITDSDIPGNYNDIYTVQTQDSEGRLSNEIVARRTHSGSVPPAVPSSVVNLRVTNGTIGSITLEWEAPRSTVSFSEYNIRRNEIMGNEVVAGSTSEFTVASTETTFSDSTATLTAGTTYRYEVYAGSGSKSFVDVVAGTTPPSAPTLHPPS